MNKLTKQLVAGSALGATALIAVPTAAVAEVSVNMDVVSKYILRGAVESESPALQGGIDYGMESGAYVGTWWSTLGTGYTENTDEIDVYGGFAGEAGGFDYDVGLVYYYYMNGDSDVTDDENNFPELYIGGGTGPFGATLYYTAADSDNEAFEQGDMYLSGTYGTDLPADFGFDITVGYAMPSDSDADSNLTDTTLSLSYPIGEASASVNYMSGGKDTADEDVDDQLWFGIGWAY